MNNLTISNINGTKKKPSFEIESLGKFYAKISQRLLTLSKLEDKIEEFETELEKLRPAELENDEARLMFYKALTRIHLDYIEAVRRAFSAIDLEAVLDAMGLLSMLAQVKRLGSDGIARVQGQLARALDDIGSNQGSADAKK